MRVADVHDLGQLRGEDQDGLALLGQLADDAVDLALGAHVDAAGRLVQHQQVGVREQALGEDHLLLVAAGELGGLLLGAAGGDPQLVDVFERDLPLLGAVDEPAAGDLPHVHDRHVAPDGQDGEQPLRSSFLRHQGDARRDDLVGRGWSFLPLKRISPSYSIDAVDGARELGLAGAHQAVEPDDLPFVDVEGDVVQLVVGEVADLEDDVRRTRPLGACTARRPSCRSSS